MKRLIWCVALVLGVSACTVGGSPMVNHTDISKVDFSQASNFKEGSDCGMTILFFGPFGSQNVVKAAQSANISKVEVVHHEVNNYILFGKSCVYVYGK